MLEQLRPEIGIGEQTWRRPLAHGQGSRDTCRLPSDETRTDETERVNRIARAQTTTRAQEILKDLESTFAKEAGGEKLARHKTAEEEQMLFVEKHKTVLDKLKDLDVNNLTPIEAINLLNQIKKEMQ